MPRLPPRGRGKLAFLALGAALLAGGWLLSVSRTGPVTGCPKGCTSGFPRTAGPLRVMVLNVFHGFPRFEDLERRLERIAQEIRRHDADLVLLQEVPWTRGSGDGARFLAERTDRNHLSARDNGNRWTIGFESALAILSRYPLRQGRLAELRPRAGPFEHRGVLAAVTSTPWGPVRVFVTHLTNGEAGVNRRQTADLVRVVSSAPASLALVGGDFNALPGSPQIRAISELWTDALAAAVPPDLGPTCCLGNGGDPPPAGFRRRIDYLFLAGEGSRAARITRSRRLLTEPFVVPGGRTFASDHAALLAEITWPGGPPRRASP